MVIWGFVRLLAQEIMIQSNFVALKRGFEFGELLKSSIGIDGSKCLGFLVEHLGMMTFWIFKEF